VQDREVRPFREHLEPFQHLQAEEVPGTVDLPVMQSAFPGGRVENRDRLGAPRPVGQPSVDRERRERETGSDRKHNRGAQRRASLDSPGEHTVRKNGGGNEENGSCREVEVQAQPSRGTGKAEAAFVSFAQGTQEQERHCGDRQGGLRERKARAAVVDVPVRHGKEKARGPSRHRAEQLAPEADGGRDPRESSECRTDPQAVEGRQGEPVHEERGRCKGQVGNRKPTERAEHVRSLARSDVERFDSREQLVDADVRRHLVDRREAPGCGPDEQEKHPHKRAQAPARAHGIAREGGKKQDHPAEPEPKHWAVSGVCSTPKNDGCASGE